MAHPKRKTSKARRDKRRSHHAIADVTLAKMLKLRRNAPLPPCMRFMRILQRTSGS